MESMVLHQDVGARDALSQARAGQLVSQGRHLALKRTSLGRGVLALRHSGHPKTVDAVVRSDYRLRRSAARLSRHIGARMARARDFDAAQLDREELRS